MIDKLKFCYRAGIPLFASVMLWFLFWIAPVHAALMPDFVSLVKKNYAAVVNISTPQTISKETRRQDNPSFSGVDENTPLYNLLRFLLNPNKQQHNRKRNQNILSLGSGFIISPDGYILTNAHVIKNKTNILVTLSDQQELPATLVGIDKLSDVALLKIDAENLPVVETGNSENLEIGQWVLAIGSPFGFDHTASQGIISGLGRSLPKDTYVPFIQTDVSINPGNSGGPLFDVEGKVIGINSQIYTQSGGSIGLSFAIPIDVALNVSKQLKTEGQVKRGWFGVTSQNLTQELATLFGLKTPAGALISGVLQGSPAQEAGIQPGDVIIEFNQKSIDHSNNLIQLIGLTKVGSHVPVKLIREGNVIILVTEIAELNEEVTAKLALAETGDFTVKELGIKISELSQEQRQFTKIAVNGVLVKSIRSRDTLKSGLRKGDVILRINSAIIENTQHFNKIVEGFEADQIISLLIRRRSGPIFLTLKILS